MKAQLLHQRDSYETQYSTNQVICQEKSKRTLYYLPCYVRFKVKQILDIQIQDLQGNIAGTLLFSFWYGNLNRQIIDQFVGQGQKAILLQFSGQQSVQLRQSQSITYKQDQKNKMIDFVVRKDFTCRLKGDVFYTPFQIINLYLSITIQSVVLDPKKNNNRRIDIKFNCMSSEDVSLIGHGDKCAVGNYQLAKYYLGAKYTNSQKNPFPSISFCSSGEAVNKKVKPIKQETGQLSKIELKPIKNQVDMTPQKLLPPIKEQKVKQDEDLRLKQFQYVHFRIPMYKYPGANLVQIFFPLQLLSFINLCIFFQEVSLSGRIAAIATLTLAFIAFIPTINQQIPQTPYIKLIEIMIYMKSIASVLCLIGSLQAWTQDPTNYVFNYKTDGYFITALILNLLVVAVTILLFVIHKCLWQPSYLKQLSTQKKETTLKKEVWNNVECDRYFSKYLKDKKLKII